MFSLGVSSEQEGTPSARGCTQNAKSGCAENASRVVELFSLENCVSPAHAPTNEKTHFTLRRCHLRNNVGVTIII